MVVVHDKKQADVIDAVCSRGLSWLVNIAKSRRAAWVFKDFSGAAGPTHGYAAAEKLKFSPRHNSQSNARRE